MELIGDLERAFAAAIYPNRVPIALAVLVLLAAVAVLGWRRRWDLAARRRPRLAIASLAAGLAIAAPLGWYLGSPLVLSTTIDEPPPVAAAPPSGTPAPRPASPASPSPGPALVVRSGTFTGADDFHFGRGTARLIETSPGSFTVRLEDFAVRNGPDLYVYLSPSRDGYATGSLEVGRLKADRGNQNYEVPPGADPAGAGSVIIWCRQFSVLFASAPLD